MIIAKMKDGSHSFINENMVQHVDYSKENRTVAIIVDEVKNAITILRDVESVNFV
jgi:hypothetical protein